MITWIRLINLNSIGNLIFNSEFSVPRNKGLWTKCPIILEMIQIIIYLIYRSLNPLIIEEDERAEIITPISKQLKLYS